jgi:galactokinase
VTLQRCRHIVTENQRVLDAVAALNGGDLAGFGALMNASHASLRDDYEVSVEPLDRLVARLQAAPGVHGARLTGAGFGGACVALCAEGEAGAVAACVLDGYAQEGGRGRVLVPPVDAGTDSAGTVGEVPG